MSVTYAEGGFDDKKLMFAEVIIEKLKDLTDFFASNFPEEDINFNRAFRLLRYKNPVANLIFLCNDDFDVYGVPVRKRDDSLCGDRLECVLDKIALLAFRHDFDKLGINNPVLRQADQEKFTKAISIYRDKTMPELTVHL